MSTSTPPPPSAGWPPPGGRSSWATPSKPIDGVSGRLGHWRIAGMPVEAEELFSKRSAEIDEAVAEKGWDSYRARGVAARATRTVKRHTPVDDLMVRWRAELAGIGLHPVDLIRSVERAAAERPAPGPVLTDDELDALVERLVAGDGPAGPAQGVLPPGRRRRRRAGVYGRDPAELAWVAAAVLRDRGGRARSSAWPAPPSGPTPAPRSSPSRPPSPPPSPRVSPGPPRPSSPPGRSTPP